MDLSVTTAALTDLAEQQEAMARRAVVLGKPDPTLPEITEYDRRRFGQAVRFEIDVCQHMADLKSDLNTIRAELTNCLAVLEQKTTGNVRRHMVHSHLAALRGELKFRRDERKSRDKRLPSQTD